MVSPGHAGPPPAALRQYGFVRTGRSTAPRAPQPRWREAQPGGLEHGILVITIARSGTHLVDSILERLPPLQRQAKVGLNAKLRWHPVNLVPGGRRVEAGIGRPHLVRVQAIEHALRRIRPLRYGMGQMPYSPELAAAARRRSLRLVVATRDPRDILVSQYLLACGDRGHILHAAVTAAPSEAEGLALLLEDHTDQRGRTKAGIARQVDALLGWTEQPDVLRVRFEDLVGPQGGGDAEAQIAAITNLSQHVGLPVDRVRARQIGDEMFGKGKTFRRGVAGGWRDHFDVESHALLLSRLGDRLERLGYADESRR